MTFYMLYNQVATLFLSLGLVTTLSFDSEVTSFIYGGGETEIYSILTSDNKTLALKPKKEGIDSNLLVQTRNGNFYFDLKSSSAPEAHKFVEVKRGQIDKALSEKKVTSGYVIWEGTKSLLLKNKGSTPLEVNGVKVIESIYLSKGIPLFINGQRVSL